MSKPGAPSLPARMLPRLLRRRENLTVSKSMSQPVPNNLRFEDVLDGIRTHKLSLRRGAELLQMPYRAFLELMAAHRVPSIDYDAGWLDKEMHLLEEGSEQTPA
jgi:predicted HTH domain antitoxin